MAPEEDLDAGERNLLLYAEDVAVARRKIVGDTVRVATVTQEREHQVDENLVHSRVEVVRVPIGKPVDVVPPIREEGDTTILSVVEEIVVVERRLILKEEVHIRRIHVSERHLETVVLREQNVEVSRTAAVAPATGDDGLLADTAPTLLQDRK